MKSNHGSNSSNIPPDNAHMSSIGGRRTPRNFDTPALRQLGEYARPHTAYSPFSHPSLAHMSTNLPPLSLHSSAPIDQITLAQLMLKEAEEKQKLQMLEKQKEMEIKSRNQSQTPQHNVPMPSTSTAAGSLFDQHNILDMHRRMAAASSSTPNLPNSSMANNPNTSSAANALSLAGTNSAAINPFMLFPTNERVVQEIQQMAAVADAASRFQADRLNSLGADHLFRLQMGLNQELHGASGPGTSFQHPSHLHPSAGSNAEAASLQLANAAAMGLPGSQFDPALHASHPFLQSSAYPTRPASIMPRSELAQPSSLYRSIEDQLNHPVFKKKILLIIFFINFVFLILVSYPIICSRSTTTRTISSTAFNGTGTFSIPAYDTGRNF